MGPEELKLFSFEGLVLGSSSWSPVEGRGGLWKGSLVPWPRRVSLSLGWSHLWGWSQSTSLGQQCRQSCNWDPLGAGRVTKLSLLLLAPLEGRFPWALLWGTRECSEYSKFRGKGEDARKKMGVKFPCLSWR